MIKLTLPLGSVVGHSGRENSVASWHRTVMLRQVTPPLVSEAFVSDVQRRLTDIDQVDGVELRDGKVLVHELDVVT